MQVHIFITFLTCTMLHESRTAAFDLYTTSRLLLYMLDICTTMTYNLRTKIKALNRFKIDWNSLLGPFTL